MEILAFSGFLLFICCGLFAYQAQEKTEQNVPTLRTQSNVVFVPALVKDQAGKLVFGLQASDFIIEDDGVEQQVSMDEAEPQEAVSLVCCAMSRRAPVRACIRCVCGCAGRLVRSSWRGEATGPVVPQTAHRTALSDPLFGREPGTHPRRQEDS